MLASTSRIQESTTQFPIIPVVGALVGFLCLVAVGAFFVLKKAKTKKEQEAKEANVTIVKSEDALYIPVHNPLVREQLRAQKGWIGDHDKALTIQPSTRQAMIPTSVNMSRLSDISAFQVPNVIERSSSKVSLPDRSSLKSNRNSVKLTQSPLKKPHTEELKQVRPTFAPIKKVMQPVRAAESADSKAAFSGLDMYNKRRSLRF